MSPEVKAILEQVAGPADFGYVDFSDVNATNLLGENALHICVTWGELDSLKVLVDAGIDINKPGEHGYTPLHYACSCGHLLIAKFLVESGADLFARTEGYIPFTVARLHGNDEICDLLSPRMAHARQASEPSASAQHSDALQGQIEKLESDIQENCDKDT